MDNGDMPFEMLLEIIKTSSNAVDVVWTTPHAEEIVSFCARVSNPSNQLNFDTTPKLLAYCIKNGHWSIFEMASMCVQIRTNRAIAAQLLRHKSFSFQEFSQRYSLAQNFELIEARRQDEKNRQNSLDDLDEDTKIWFKNMQQDLWEESKIRYDMAIKKGIAKECARFLLPLSTETTLYMTGSLRSWITYLQVRLDKSTQKEHRDIAEDIKKIFVQKFPIISEALEWV